MGHARYRNTSLAPRTQDYPRPRTRQHRGTKTIEQGAEVIVRMALTGPDGPAGTFTDEHGRVPW